MSRLSAAESLAAGLRLISEYGLYIFPLVPGTKNKPLIKGYRGGGSNTPKQVEAWAGRWPGCNWAVDLVSSNIQPLDVDVKSESKPDKVGDETLAALEMLYEPLPETFEVRSPSGGKHLYFRGRNVFALGKGGFGEDIDSPQYLVAPGSRTETGTYDVVSLTDEIAQAPAWFYGDDLLGQAEKLKANKIADVSDAAVDELDKDGDIAWVKDMLANDAEIAVAGKNGNNQTWKIAAQVRGRAISQDLCLELMLDYYNDRCDPPWTAEELAKIVANAYNYSMNEKVGAKTATAEFVENDKAEIDVASIPTMGDPKIIAAEAAERRSLRQRAERVATEDNGGTPPPVNQKVRKPTLINVLDEWAYVAGIDQFVSTTDSNKIWKRTSFDSYFRSINPKVKLSDELLKRTDAKAIRKFERLGYLPGSGISIDGGKTLNLYRKSDVTPTSGDTKFWDEHLAFLFPDAEQRDHLLNWLAWFYQNLSQKPKHALLIQGHEQGTGKSFIVDMLGAIIGQHNVSQVSQNDLASNFNGYAMRCKLIAIEELRALDKGSVKAALHDIITQDIISINEKNLPKIEMRNCFGIVCMTNDDAAINLDVADRRYLVLRTEAAPRDPEYYSELYGKLNDPAAVAAVAYALQTRDVGDYNGASRAPQTEAKKAMIETSLSDLERWMKENGHQFPLCGRVITLRDVASILPPKLEKLPRLDAQIAAGLKKHFRGVSIGQRRLSDKSRPTLWAINGCPVKSFGDPNYAITIYELDAAKGKAGKPITSEGSATEEFLTDDSESDKET